MTGLPDPIRVDPGFRRLDTATMWLPAIELVRGLMLPGLIASFFFSPVGVLMACSFFVLLPIAIGWVIHYWSFSYCVGESSIVVRSGLLGKTIRHIPFERIQDVRMHQSLLYRLLGYTKVEVETAARESVEVSLDLVTLEESESIRSALMAHRTAAARSAPTAAAVVSNLVHRNTNRELALGGMTTQVVAFIGAVAGAVGYFHFMANMSEMPWASWSRWSHAPWSWEDWGAKFTAHAPWLKPVLGVFLEDTLAKAIVLATGALGVAMAKFVVTYYGFTLTRRGDVLTRSFGLSTRLEFSVACTRIQVVRVDANLLRRWVGLAGVRLDTASHREIQAEEAKRPIAGILLPVVPSARVPLVLEEVLPGMKWSGIEWCPVSSRAVSRKTRKEGLLVLAAVGPSLMAFGPYGLTLLALMPLLVIWNRAWYRNLAYAVTHDYFLVRNGWFSWSMSVVALRSIQSVSLYQSPLQRRAGLTTFSMEVAGSDHTGGVPEVPYLDSDVAVRLRRRLLREVAVQPIAW